MTDLLGSSSTSTFSTGLGSDLLTGWYSARSAQSLAASSLATAASFSATSNQAPVTPPWDSRAPQPTPDERLRSALGSQPFIDENASTLSSPNATASEQKLFALYNGLAKLSAIANNAADKTTPDIMLATLNARFANGLKQVLDYAGTLNASDLAVIPGQKSTSANAKILVPQQLSTYTTKVMQRGLPTDPIEGLSGAEDFKIAVTKGGTTTTVDVNLADLGQSSVSLTDLVNIVNQRLEDAGMKTRVKAERIYAKNADGKDPSPLPQTWGLKIEGTSIEKLNFSAPSAGTAVYLAGTTGSPNATSAQMLKLDATTSSPALVTSARIQAVDPNAVASATTTTPAPTSSTTPGGTATSAATPPPPKTTVGGSAIDGNGNLYVVGTTEGSLSGEVLQGTSDVYLTKYDSTGKVAWQRMMGAATDAQGLSVAVDASGNVVVAGRVLSGFDKAGAPVVSATDAASIKNITSVNTSYNSFVAKYDASGQEKFTRDVGPLTDDGASAVAVGPDGSIYFGGHTKGAIASGAASAGGEDAFITKLSATGSLIYTRQFGTSGTDRLTGLAVDADGNLVASSMQGTHGVVQKFDAASGSSPALWSQDLGDLAGGEAAALAVDGGHIYVGGTTGTAAVGGGTVHGSYSGGSDGFYVALGSAGAIQNTTFIGTGSTDRIHSITAVNGEVYVAGDTTGDLGAGVPGGVNGFAAKFDVSGAQAWTYQYSGREGQARTFAISVDPQGSSVLDVLGLPKGKLNYTQATSITAQSSVRAGDEFSISVNGGPPRAITISATDSLTELTNKINNVLLLDGKATIRHVSGASSLTIRTSSPGTRIDLIAGPAGKDALEGLGLSEGTIVNDLVASNTDNTSSDPVLARLFGAANTSSHPPLYVGLSLESNLNIDTRAGAGAATQTIQDAMSNLRTAFRKLTAPPPSSSGPGGTGGTVPAYLKAQLANYQAGLARLASGSPDITSLF